MRSVVWRAGGGVRNRILPVARGAWGHLVLSRAAVLAAVVAVAVVGCAPHYKEPSDAVFDAADATAPSRPRPKIKMPVPSHALLTPQAEPRCEDPNSTAGNAQPVKADPKRLASAEAPQESAGAAQSPGESTTAAAKPPPGVGEADASLALRIKLEYERECYRQAELRTRNRLRQLQESVGATVKAVEAQKH